MKNIIQKTNQVIKTFATVEQRPWGIEGCMIELTKQVGELAKSVMMLENYYLAARDQLVQKEKDQSRSVMLSCFKTR
ncbi:MAG: hypothetical protein ABH807_02880 [Candidatus Shapirobacteria bacterium]